MPFPGKNTERIAILFSRDRPNPETEPRSPGLAGGFFTVWTTRGSPAGELSPKDPWEKHYGSNTNIFFSKYLTEKMKLPSNQKSKRKKPTTHNFWLAEGLLSPVMYLGLAA